MIPPEEVIHVLVEQIEAQAHKDGWDVAPTLLVLTVEAVSALGHAVAIGVAELPFGGFVDGNPAVLLRQTADQFGEGHLLAGVAQKLATPQFCGLAFVSEGWMQSDEDPEKLKKLLRERSLADVPGSIEIRSVVVVDTAGRLTYWSRQRGKPPEMWAGDDNHDGLRGIGGRVAGALRDMVLAVALHMPRGTADVDALRGITIEAARG